MPIDRSPRRDATHDEAGHLPVAPGGRHGAVGPAGHAAVSRILAEHRHAEDVAHMSLPSRLFHAAMHSGHEIEHEVLEQLVLALEIAVPIWIVSHAFGIGEVLDGLAFLFSANEIATAIEELIAYFRAARAAQNEADLEKAGAHFGKAVALIGMSVLVSFCAKFVTRGAHGGGHAEPHATPHAEPHAEPHAAPHAEPHAAPSSQREQLRSVIGNLKSRHHLAEHAERSHSLGGTIPALTDPSSGVGTNRR